MKQGKENTIIQTQKLKMMTITECALLIAMTISNWITTERIDKLKERISKLEKNEPQ